MPAIELSKAAHSIDEYVINDLFQPVAKRIGKEAISTWFLHIGPINQYIVDFIYNFGNLTGYLVDDDYARYHRLINSYGTTHRIFFMNIGPQDSNADPIPINESENQLNKKDCIIRPYPFRRSFSFISICKGDYSFSILSQINLNDCYLLAIECSLSYVNPKNKRTYKHYEQKRTEIFEYCNKYKLMHVHTGENILIFYRT